MDYIRPLKRFVADNTRDRDLTHGVSHMWDVVVMARKIFKRIPKASAGGRVCEAHSDVLAERIVSCAAMVHDAIDHKYPDVDRDALRRCIADSAFHGDLTMADLVIKIADNTSYSKEVREGHPAKILGPLTILRNIVSDADKIEAMGYEGIERCRAYARHLEPTMEPKDIEECVAQHTREKLVRLFADGFIRTGPGREIADPLYLELVEYLEQQ